MKIPIVIICMLSLLISACIGCSNISNDNVISLPDAIYTEKNGHSLGFIYINEIRWD